MTLSPRARRVGAAGALAALTASLALVLALVAPVGIAAGGPGAGATRPQRHHLTVRITAHHSRFTPASVDVPPGATVRFVIRNLDPIDHELIVGGPEVHQRHEVGREAHHHGRVPGEISVPAGTTASTTWTAPQSVGPVAFACHLPGHFAYGMSGVVRVATDVRTRS